MAVRYVILYIILQYVLIHLCVVSMNRHVLSSPLVIHHHDSQAQAVISCIMVIWEEEGRRDEKMMMRGRE